MDESEMRSAAQSTWHPGELQLQQAVGAAERMAELGPRVVRDYLPDQHRAFFAQLPFVVAGSVDAQGQAWATLLAGPPGFVASPDMATLELAVRPDPADPATVGLRPGSAIGLLGIELQTRRRNRANGRLVTAADGQLRLAVTQSFGNCPKYIQLRDLAWDAEAAATPPAPVERSDGLDDAARAAIASADTFFVASYADRGDQRQVDVSHRGGKPGFVRVAADGRLTVPDFSGNQFFMTLGNIALNGRAGLVFVDFERGDLLQLSGVAEVILAGPEVDAYPGAERVWTFQTRSLSRRRGALPLRGRLRDNAQSPFLANTGDWAA